MDITTYAVLNKKIKEVESKGVSDERLNDAVSNSIKFNELNEQYEHIDTKVKDVEERVQAIEENGVGGGNANIDDTTISKISTWSSEKIEDFVHTNDDVIWSTVQGENLSIEYTKEGYFREVEIWGNTLQNENNLEDIRHLGQLYVDESGQPILDGEGREQYKIEIESRNFYNEEELLTITPKTHKTTILLPCQLCKVGDAADRLYWDSEEGKYIIEKNIAGPEVFKNLSLITNTYEVNDNKYYFAEFTSPVPFTSNTINILTTKLKVNNALWGNIDSEGIRGINKAITMRVLFDKVTDITIFVNDMDIYIETSNPQLIETTILEQLKIPSYKDKTHIFITGEIDGDLKAKAPLDGGKAIASLSAMNLSLENEVSTLSLENEEITEVNNTQDTLINTTMMATDEVYTMLEPILEMMPMTISIDGEMKGGSSKMVDMYVAMVQRGLKTIEQVPARYREEVREILAKLEK